MKKKHSERKEMNISLSGDSNCTLAHIHTETSTSVFPHSIQPQIIQNHFFHFFFGFAGGEPARERERGPFCAPAISFLLYCSDTVTSAVAAPHQWQQQKENGAAASLPAYTCPFTVKQSEFPSINQNWIPHLYFVCVCVGKVCSLFWLSRLAHWIIVVAFV